MFVQGDDTCDEAVNYSLLSQVPTHAGFSVTWGDGRTHADLQGANDSQFVDTLIYMLGYYKNREDDDS